MKKSEINRLDKIARDKVKEDYKGCVICGNPKVNVHHVEGRRIKSLRWYLPNLIPLCPLHHTFGMFSAHQSPMRMRKELIDIFGTKWEKNILKQGLKICKSTYQQVLDYLNGIKNNYC